MLNINVEIFIVLMVGMSFDWIFQTRNQAFLKINNSLVRLRHSFIYAITSTFLLSLFYFNPYTLTFIFVILILSHFIIDDRRFVRWVMKYIKNMRIIDIKQSGWMEIAIDQWLHVWIIFIISIFL